MLLLLLLLLFLFQFLLIFLFLTRTTAHDGIEFTGEDRCIDSAHHCVLSMRQVVESLNADKGGKRKK
jgi:hypothetical protein